MSLALTDPSRLPWYRVRLSYVMIIQIDTYSKGFTLSQRKISSSNFSYFRLLSAADSISLSALWAFFCLSHSALSSSSQTLPSFWTCIRSFLASDTKFLVLIKRSFMKPTKLQSQRQNIPQTHFVLFTELQQLVFIDKFCKMMDVVET